MNFLITQFLKNWSFCFHSDGIECKSPSFSLYFGLPSSNEKKVSRKVIFLLFTALRPGIASYVLVVAWVLHCTLIWVVFTNVALRSHSFTNPDRLSWLHGGMSAWRVASMIWDDSKALDVTHFLASFKTGQLQYDHSRSPVVWLMFCTYSVNSLHQSLNKGKISKYLWWYTKISL